MKWINIKDALPEGDGCDYMLVGGLDDDGRFVKSVSHWCGGEWSMLGSADEHGYYFGFYSDCGEWEFKKEWITHWMSIDYPKDLDV